jgi:plasmid maintenance system killer protein
MAPRGWLPLYTFSSKPTLTLTFSNLLFRFPELSHFLKLSIRVSLRWRNKADFLGIYFWKYIATWRPISRQRPKYVHATIEKVLQEVFSMISAPCPLLRKRSLNTFPQKQTSETIGHVLLGDGGVNRLCQQYRLCFLWDPCKVVIRVEFRSW